MLPDFGLITKEDKLKLDSIPSDTLLTEIVASETYVTKAAASETYITRADAQRYINDALDGGGGSTALDTININSTSYTARNDSYYYKSSATKYAERTIYSSASNSTIETNSERTIVYNDGSNNVFISNGRNDSIFGFTASDTLIVKSGGFHIEPSNDEGLRVNNGLNSILLRGKRLEGTTDYNADNFVTIPAGTNLNIHSNKKTVAVGAIQGTSGSDLIENHLDNVHILASGGADTIINYGTNCTIEGEGGSEYIYDLSSGGNVFLCRSSHISGNQDNICGFKTNDTIVFDGVTATTLEGDSQGYFYCYIGNASTYFRLFGERKPQYQTEQYASVFSYNYYDSLQGGQYFWIKNNSVEAEQVMIFGKTSGSNITGSNNYWKYAISSSGYVRNSGDFVTVVSAVGKSTICNDENATTGAYGYCNLYQRPASLAADHIWGYDASSTIHITDDVPYYILPTLNGEYGVILTDDFSKNYYVGIKGKRISGKTGYTAADYASLSPNNADTFQIKIADKPAEVIYVNPTYYMTSTKYTNSEGGLWICGTSAANTIENTGNNVSIHSCAGNNRITNTGGASCFLAGNTGNDTIISGGDHCTIFGVAGTNSIKNDGEYVWVKGGTAADSIYSTGDFCTIDGGNGNNYFNNSGADCTIIGGTGNDTVVNSGARADIDGGASILSASMLAGATNCTVKNEGTSYVTLYSGADNCYIDFSNYQSTLIADSAAPTLTTANAAYVSLGANCHNASIVCSGFRNDTIYSTGSTARNNGHHYINVDKTSSGSTYNYITLYDGFNTIIAGASGANSINIYNPDSLGGSGSYYNYIEFNGATGYMTLRGSSNDTIVCGSGSTYILYPEFTNGPTACSIVGGTGVQYITLCGAAWNTIESGAGSDKIFIAEGFYNVYSFGNAEGSNYIYGVSSYDTLFIKDNSAVSVGANNSSGLNLKIGTNTYVTLKGGFISGKTDFAAAASYNSITSGNVCYLKYANGTESILTAP